MKTIRILLADDHVLVRAGFRSLLQNLSGLEVVGEANNGSEALQRVEELKPDVVLMDVAMPELNGLEATARLTKEFPETRVILLSMHSNPEYARRAVRAGAAGYLLKTSAAAELEIAIKGVARGETYLTPAISKYITSDYAKSTIGNSPLDRLTTRHREILGLLAQGYTRKEIAQKLNISVKTFDTYRVQLMEILDIHDRAALLRYANRMGLIVDDDKLDDHLGK